MSTKSQAQMHTEDGDQINAPGRETDPRPSHEQGKENSHQNLDSKDQKSIANKLDQASKQEDRENQQGNDKPPTAAARDHGNEPSKGAKIDEALEAEDQAILRKKGIIKD